MQNKTLQMKRAMRTALLVLLLSVAGMGKMVAQEFTVGDLNYSLITDGTTITARVIGHVDGTSASGILDIPESVNYNGISYAVTAIGNNAFSGCYGLTGSLTIPDCVTSIGSAAFKDCRGFNGHLTISDNVTAIWSEAFSGCINLTGNLTIPNSLTILQSSVFANCFSLTGSLIIPNSVTGINNNAFYHCAGLTGDLVIPSSVTTIESWAFSSCDGFTSITIPNSVTSIGSNVFSSDGVEQIIVDSGNPVYDSRNNCNGVIETATNTLIIGCKNTIIPNTVTSIGEDAFNGCKGLLSISIPNSVTEISTNPFKSCDELEQIIVDAGNTVFDSRGDCNAIIETNANKLIVGCRNTYIPNSVFSIGRNAFFGCYGLTCITIPNSVTSIESMAFAFCGVNTVIALSTTPPDIFGSTFYSVKEQLIVSCGSKEAYEASDWANYFTFIEEDCDTHNISIDESNINGGNVSASVNSTELGEEVQLTVTPNEGMELVSLVVYNSINPEQTVPVYPLGKASSVYGFLMPPFDVVITAIFGPATTIGENNEALALVYPNPTNGQINIEAENLKHITINNMLGQTIYECNASGNAFGYDFSKHKAGIYLIRIETASGVSTKKVFVTQ